ncbi:hypothetical protein J6590_022407 [Homalodisca vitripennis]|nr:hypothetical protein J6590_022407 [Homalodisca vitripennis]
MLRFKVNASHLLLHFDDDFNLSSLNLVNDYDKEDVVRRRRSVGTSPGQSPAKSPRATPATNSATATESDTPRPVSSRTYKRITPLRESPRLRPRSNSGVLERQSSSSPPTSETVPAPAPAVNGVSSPPAPEEPLEVLPETPSLPDVVVLPSRPSSILKKKSLDETSSTSPPAAVFGRPVSILKRKTSQEEGSTTTSQPVTFSPSVVEPTARRQGILKKHCSLDEGSGGVGVLARRSASPDKPILKQQRRSSLEDLRRRTHSPEPQSILKRKTSRDEVRGAPICVIDNVQCLLCA